MSRCFPFPPPGYEKKASIADEDLLAKPIFGFASKGNAFFLEKHKEKRHKKEKKDKEKREGKEKKDRDGHREKHREKKDRKEQHKERDRERDKEKNRSSDAEGYNSQKGIYNGEKLDSCSSCSYEITDSERVQELVRRVRDQNGASGSQMFLAATDDRRARVQDMSSESSVDRIPEKEKAEDKTEDHRRGKVKDISSKSSVDRKPEKEQVEEEKGDRRKANGQRNHVMARAMEKQSLQNSSPMDQERGEPTAKALGKEDADKRMEGKERNKHKERQRKDGKDKHRDKDRGKDKTLKDKDRDKEKKKEEKAKENRELSNEQPKLKESDPKLKQISNDPLDFRIITSDPLNLSNTSLAGDVNYGKRKELERNGFLLDEGSRSKKSARLDSLPPPVVENGRKLEPSHSSFQFKLHGPTNGHGVEMKEIKINGFITPQQPNESSAKPLPAYVTRNVNDDESVKSKPPHPDIKYLRQILSVPTMEDFSDSLEEEWLFGGNNLKSKNLNMGSAVDQMHQVWSEAIWIESANIAALPYVARY